MGSTDQGLALIEQGMNAYRGLKTPPVFWPLLLHLCAGAYALALKPEKGLATDERSTSDHNRQIPQERWHQSFSS